MKIPDMCFQRFLYQYYTNFFVHVALFAGCKVSGKANVSFLNSCSFLIAYMLSDIPGYYDMEPGFDFAPDLGEFPATVTLTIQEGETESNQFVLQVLDDCHLERDEGFMFSPVSLSAQTEGGTLYSVSDQSSNFVFEEDENPGKLYLALKL